MIEIAQGAVSRLLLILSCYGFEHTFYQDNQVAILKGKTSWDVLFREDDFELIIILNVALLGIDGIRMEFVF